jgi:hypothetical protein
MTEEQASAFLAAIDRSLKASKRVQAAIREADFAHATIELGASLSELRVAVVRCFQILQSDQKHEAERNTRQ